MRRQIGGPNTKPRGDQPRESAGRRTLAEQLPTTGRSKLLLRRVGQERLCVERDYALKARPTALRTTHALQDIQQRPWSNARHSNNTSTKTRSKQARAKYRIPHWGMRPALAVHGWPKDMNDRAVQRGGHGGGGLPARRDAK